MKMCTFGFRISRRRVDAICIEHCSRSLLALLCTHEHFPEVFEWERKRESERNASEQQSFFFISMQFLLCEFFLHLKSKTDHFHSILALGMRCVRILRSLSMWWQNQCLCCLICKWIAHFRRINSKKENQYKTALVSIALWRKHMHIAKTSHICGSTRKAYNGNSINDCKMIRSLSLSSSSILWKAEVQLAAGWVCKHNLEHFYFELKLTDIGLGNRNSKATQIFQVYYQEF